MITVELYSRDDCTLCDRTRDMLKKLRKEFHFDLREISLTEDHPKFREFLLAIPVVIVNGKRRLESDIRDQDIRRILKEEHPPSRLFHFAKFLEALGFITVGVGLMYGVMGNMWIDLYFFLAGVFVFVCGRTLEKREMRGKAMS